MAWERTILTLFDLEGTDTVVDAALGTKRTCPSCAGRFYDLDNDPIVCPLCSESFVVEPILPSKADAPAPSNPVEAPPTPKPAAAEDDDDDATKDDVDDEVAGIEDVDLGEDDEVLGEDDDNTFLETDDDENDNVSDIVAPGPKGDDET